MWEPLATTVVMRKWHPKLSTWISQDGAIQSISKFFYLYTTTNKDNTVKLIKKILLETLANDEESVDSFFNTMISNNNLVVNNQTMKDYLVVDQSATSITDYFINNYDGSARNEVVLLGSTNSNNFKYIIDFLLNEE